MLVRLLIFPMECVLIRPQIFRCWKVYSKSWRVVAFSILLYLGGTACAVMILRVEATLHSHTLITSNSLNPLILSFWVLTIVQNIITTGQSATSMPRRPYLIYFWI